MSEHQIWAAYCRVSSPTQANKKRPNKNADARGTLENQKEALTAWAKQKGVGLRWYTDVMSGKKNMGEPKFLKMMSDLANLNLAGVAVAALDRLGRDGLGLMKLTRELKAMGKELISLREGDQKLQSALHSASDQLMRDLLSLIADYDHALTVQKMRDGLERYKANGGKVGRKEIPVDWQKADPLIKAGVSARAIGELLGLNPHTARKKVQRRRIELGIERRCDG